MNVGQIVETYAVLQADGPLNRFQVCPKLQTSVFEL